MVAAIGGDLGRVLPTELAQYRPDCPLEQKGGYDLHFSEESLEATVAKYETLKANWAAITPTRCWATTPCASEEPHIGPKVVGAILHHQDGHANPLKLLLALAADVRRLGGRDLNGKIVTE